MTTWSEKLRALEQKNLLPVAGEESAFNRLLGYNIAAARERKGLLQKQLAHKVSVTQSAWSRIEKGEIRITVYDLMVCAKVLDIPLTRLIPP